MFTMKHKLACIEAKALRKHDDPFPFYRNFDDTYYICIRCQCPVDRVFRNCGVRNSEVLLYLQSGLFSQSRSHIYNLFTLVTVVTSSSLYYCRKKYQDPLILGHEELWRRPGQAMCLD